MKRQITFLTIAAAASLIMTTARAEIVALVDYGCNIDGTTSVPTDGDGLLPGMDISGLDTTTGLGKVDSVPAITIDVGGEGAHTVICWVDHEIDESINTFFNEEGEIGGGVPVTGQSWEIDVPGLAASVPPKLGSSKIPYFGDIFENVECTKNTDDSLCSPTDISLLGNDIFYDAFDDQSLAAPDDVSMAIGFDFSLNPGETAVVSFFLDFINRAPGFYLHQWDPDSIIAETIPEPNDIYFWASNTISGGGGGPTPVPEPGTIGLLGLGLMGIAGMRRRKRKQS